MVLFKTYEKALPLFRLNALKLEHTIHDKITNNIENVFQYY